MRIRTMLNRKMKLIWKEESARLASAPPTFPPISPAEAMGRAGETGAFLLLHALQQDVCIYGV